MSSDCRCVDCCNLTCITENISGLRQLNLSIRPSPRTILWKSCVCLFLDRQTTTTTTSVMQFQISFSYFPQFHQTLELFETSGVCTTENSKASAHCVQVLHVTGISVRVYCHAVCHSASVLASTCRDGGFHAFHNEYLRDFILSIYEIVFI